MGAEPSAADRSESPPPSVRDYTYQIASATALALLSTGTVVYHHFEGWSWVDSFYFCAVAVTTVGFGDLTPTTDFTKLFTVFYIFAGVSLVGIVLNERLHRHAQRRSEKAPARKRRRRGPAPPAEDP